ncbi:MAG: hypothetical protein ACP5N2_00695 [Candidatus Nanoarchaeia archaeon]
MKNEIDSLEKTYNLCLSNGYLKEKYKDCELAISLKEASGKGLKFIDNASKSIAKESDEWTFIFRDYYESLRMLIEAYLLLEGFEAEHHQCKNAFICFRHPELNLDWEFLEIIRLKRNALNYRGNFLNYDSWILLKPKFILHLTLLKNEIENKLTFS